MRSAARIAVLGTALVAGCAARSQELAGSGFARPIVVAPCTETSSRVELLEVGHRYTAGKQRVHAGITVSCVEWVDVRTDVRTDARGGTAPPARPAPP